MAEMAATIMRPKDMRAFSGLKSHKLDIGYSSPLRCAAMYIPGRFFGRYFLIPKVTVLDRFLPKTEFCIL